MRQGTGYKTRPDDLCPASISRFFQQVRDCKIEWNNFCPIFWARNCTSDSIMMEITYKTTFPKSVLKFNSRFSVLFINFTYESMKLHDEIKNTNIFEHLWLNVRKHFYSFCWFTAVNSFRDPKWYIRRLWKSLFSDISDWLLKEIILTILSGKSCVYSIQYKNGCLAASDLFHIFT